MGHYHGRPEDPQSNGQTLQNEIQRGGYLTHPHRGRRKRTHRRRGRSKHPDGGEGGRRKSRHQPRATHPGKRHGRTTRFFDGLPSKSTAESPTEGQDHFSQPIPSRNRQGQRNTGQGRTPTHKEPQRRGHPRGERPYQERGRETAVQPPKRLLLADPR